MSLYADCYDTAPTNDVFCVLPYTQSAHLFSIRKQLHPYMVFQIGTSIRGNVQQVITVMVLLLCKLTTLHVWVTEVISVNAC